MGIWPPFRLGRRSLLAALAVLALVVGVAVWLAPERLAFRDHASLVQHINRAIHPLRIEAEDSTVSLLRSPGRISVILDGVDLRSQSGDPFLQARRLSAQFGLAALAGGTPQIRAVRLDEPELAVEGDAGLVTALSDGGMPVYDEALKGAMSDASVEFAVVDGRIRWRSSHGEWLWEGVRFSADGLTGTGSGEGEARLVSSHGADAGMVEWTANWREGGVLALAAKATDLPMEALFESAVELAPGSRVSAELEAEYSPEGGLRSVHGEFSVDAGMRHGESGPLMRLERASGSFRYRPESNSVDMSGMRLEFPDLRLTGGMILQLDPAGEVAEVTGNLATEGGAFEFSEMPPLTVGLSSARFAYRPATGGLALHDMRLATEMVTLSGGVGITRVDDGLTAIQLDIDQIAYEGMQEGVPSFVANDLRGILDYDPADRTLNSRGISARFGAETVGLELSAASRRGDLSGAELTLKVSALTAEQLLEFWPDRLMPMARSWVVANVQAAHFSPAIRVSGFDGVPHAEVDFSFSEGAFLVAAGLPPLKDTAGKGSIGKEGMSIEVEQGVFVANQGRVQLRSASYALQSRTGAFEIQAKLGGTASATFSLAEGILAEHAYVPPVTGDAELEVELSGQTGAETPAQVLDYSVRAAVSNVHVSGNGYGIGVEHLTGSVVLEPERVEFRGAAMVGGLPTAFKLERTEQDRFRLSGDIQLRNMQLTKANTRADGTVPFDVQFALASGGRGTYSLEAGLDGVDLLLVGEFPLPLSGVLRAEGRIGSEAVVLERATLSGQDANLVMLDPLELRENYALRVAGTLSSDWVRRIAPDLVSSKPGLLPLRLAVRAGEDGTNVLISGWADIALVEVAVAQAGYRKPAGEAGEIEFEGRLSDSGLHLGRFAIESEAVSSSGSLRFDSAGRLVEAAFDSIRMGSRSQFAAIVGRAEGGGLDVEIKGNSLDLCDLARFGGKESSEGCLVTGGGAAGNVRLSLHLRRLHFNEIIWLEDAEGVVSLDADRSPEGFVSGAALGGESARVILADADANGVNLTFIADDAGELLGALGYASEVESGSLNYSLQKDGNGGKWARLRITDVYVYDTNLITKLISFISAFGLIEFVLSGREYFSEVEMAIEERDGVVRIVDGYATSNNVSFAFSGEYNVAQETVDVNGFAIPARFVRRILGEIPILSLLIPDEEDADSIGVGFRMHGPVSDPELEVRPLSVLETLIPGLRERSANPEEETEEN